MILDPHVVLDGQRLLDDIESLAAIGRRDGELHRIAYSAADLEGRAWIEAEMRGLGMAVSRDAAGNTIGHYPGTDASLPPIALGSHTDTVPNAGKYDGALGVLAGLACVRALRSAGTRLRHPIEVINFAAEEASMPGATFGSRAMAGLLPREIVDQPAWDGEPVAAHLRRADLDPQRILEARRPPGSLAAYLELHVEQGGILDRAGCPIGIVRGIVGIRRFRLTFHGQANHAGTTPMEGRRDALVMASTFVLKANEVGRQRGIVCTVGTLTVDPNAPNVIPGRVELTFEFRALDEAVLDAAQAELLDYAAVLGAAPAEIVRKPPVPSDTSLLAILNETCASLGLRSMELASGAGHDAMCMASLCPSAMIFVPSRGGISHSPDEYTAPDDCVNGARVLLAALLRLDQVLATERAR